MNMLASMRYLVALSEHRHYARAAQSCHITQPALSNALRALEKEFGIAIVKRGRTYAGLTPEGEQVLATAQRMLREHELLQQELRSSASQPQGTLQLGVVPTAVPVATRFAAQLRKHHPGISPVVRSLSSQEIELGLENLSLDLGLGFVERLNQRSHRFELLPQYTEHYFVVRRAPETARTQLHLGPPMSWRDAAQLPLCLLTPDMHNRSIVDKAFAGLGLQVKPVMETNSILALALSVVAGDVCSVLPGALVDAVRSHPELEALPLVAPALTTPVGFFTLGACRTWGVESENRPQRGQFLPDLQTHSPAMGQKDGEKWTAAVDLQPTIPTPDRLLAKTSPSRALQAALRLARDEAWLQHAAQHSGALHSDPESAHT